MDDNTMWLLVKIGATVGSFILLWVFKKQLIKMVTDVVVGSDTTEYEGRNYTDIRDGMEAKMDEVLK